MTTAKHVKLLPLALACALAAPAFGSTPPRPPQETPRPGEAPAAATGEASAAPGGSLQMIGPVVVRLSDVPGGDPDRIPGVLRGHAQGSSNDVEDDEGELGGGLGDFFASSDAVESEAPVPAPLADPDDPNAPNAPAAPQAAGDILRSFAGQSATGWIPPDPVIAVGPKYIVESVNSGLTIYTKDGGLERSYNDLENGLFAPLLPYLPSPWSFANGKVFDPRVIYDPFHNKFVLLALASDSNAQKSYAFVAISHTDNPLGAWSLYYFYDGYNTDTWIDYSGMSADDFGFYFTGNEYYWAGGFKHAIVYSVRPTIFTDTGTAGWIFWGLHWPNAGNPLARELQPAVPYTGSSIGATYFVNTFNSSGNQACLWEMTGDRGNAPHLDPYSVTVDAYASPPLARQPGTVLDDIETFYAGALTAAYDNHKLYFSVNSNDSSNSGFYVSKINTDSHVQDRAINYFTGGLDYYYPAVGLVGSDLFNNPMVGVPMTYSGDTAYPSAAFKLYTNFLVDTSGPFWATAGGSGTYNVYYQGRNRWGDYMGVAHDWTCNTLWSVAELAPATNTWRTQIVELAGDTALPASCRLIFDDGFERGSTANWSSTTP